MDYTNTNGATNPAKDKFVANLAKTSPGSYQGISINPGTDAEVAAQIRAIDSRSSQPINQSTNPNVPAVEQKTADPFETYLKSLEQPTEVTEATKYVNSLITQGKLDEEKALNMGETMGFATGEAARVGKQNSIRLDAAARSLDALVAANASKKEIAKARYDYEKAKADSMKTSSFELSPGQQRYEYDPKTGKTKLVASVPKEPKEVTYSERKDMAQKLAQRKISSLMDTAKRDEEGFVDPASYRDMRAAWVADGYSGSDFDSIFGGYANPTKAKQYGTTFQTKPSGNYEERSL